MIVNNDKRLKFMFEYIFCVDNVFYTNIEQREKLKKGESVDWGPHRLFIYE